MEPRFTELLPWYVNGTLEASDRAYVEQCLAEDPQARAELDWYRSLQSQMRRDAPQVPETLGLARTLHLIRGDRPTLAERVEAWFGALGMRPAWALAGLSLMVLQGGVIHQLLQSAPDARVELRSTGSPRVDTGQLLRLSFAPQATEADLRLLLVSVQGDLAAGPSATGDYLVRVPPGQAEISLARLKASPLVRSVTLSAEPAPRPPVS